MTSFAKAREAAERAIMNCDDFDDGGQAALDAALSAFEEAGFVLTSPDQVWTALLHRCAAHKPEEHDKVRRLVMIGKEDIAAAIAERQK